ncbi:MAG: Fe-S cluster assembly ATPase SufC [Bacilli bacterium]|nr:Fe-S cluster assembly ATPase SufC [Bacilli bacterium]
MLKLENLKLRIDEKILFENLNLEVNSGEIHVLMGKNGVGKSSIAKAIIGDPNYQVEGNIFFNENNITNLDIYERAKKGIYLLNQSPIQIEGITNAEMLRAALSEKTGKGINIFEFNKELEIICQKLELDKSFIHREINVGCSGGERKKIELLHMWMLKPSLIILDEVDSGLDVDAIKLVANSIKEYFEEYKPGILIITHSSTLINTFDDYKVHLLGDKKLIKSGNKELANEVLNKGFKELSNTFVISEN